MHTQPKAAAFNKKQNTSFPLHVRGEEGARFSGKVRFFQILTTLICAWVFMATPAFAEAPIRFDIVSQPLPSALKTFAAQADMQLLYNFKAVSEATANTVQGEYDKKVALQQLLKGTNLEVIYSADNAATIRPKSIQLSSVEMRVFHIAVQPLPDALNDWADQAGMQVLWAAQMPSSQREAPEVEGRFSADAALERVLAGSGLTFTFLDEKTVSIRLAAAAGDVVPPSPSKGEGRDEDQGVGKGEVMRAAQASSSQAAPSQREGKGEDLKQADQDKTISEVVVTGTHIRGVQNSASPMRTFTRDEVDRSGLGSAQEFILRLPENFKGGASEGTVGIQSGGGRTLDATGGTGVNLRGLGNDATLVLLNGRRMAPGNTSGNFVDVSLVPLAALERIEIVKDGSSAIYGSDAVGGVVNFILRPDFDGGESRIRYGSVTKGGAREFQFGQTFGRTWNSGAGLVSYEFFDRTALDANDRDYVVARTKPFELLPDQKRHSVLLTGHFDPTATTQLFADFIFADRAQEETVVVAGPTHREANVQILNGTLGGRAQVSEALNFELSSSYAESVSHIQQRFNGNLFVDREPRTSIWSIDGKVDGTAFEIPSGAVRYALGGQYREEDLNQLNNLNNTRFAPSRDISAAFVELNIPLISGRSSGANLLEVNVADRYERYSDFGSTNNPKIGLVVRPSSSLAVRATYGTSFKAPLLADLNPVPFQTVTIPQVDPQTGGRTNTLIVFGGNPDLQPEDAETWTAGVDWAPTQGFNASLSYYRIKFTDRIADAQTSGFRVDDALRSEAILGPQIIQRNPPLASVAALMSLPGFFNACGQTPCPASSVMAIVDSRALNLASLDTSGIDFHTSVSRELSMGLIGLGLDATYIFDYENRTTDTAPVNSVLNTQFNPVDLRLRGSASLEKNAWLASMYITYVDSYKDTLGGVTTPVSSWTTADLSLTYRVEQDQGLLSGFSATLGAINVTDEDPPFVPVRPPLTGNNPALNFDGANANVLGRFIYMQLSKRW